MIGGYDEAYAIEFRRTIGELRCLTLPCLQTTQRKKVPGDKMDNLGKKLNELVIRLKLCGPKEVPYNPPDSSAKSKPKRLTIAPAPWTKKRTSKTPPRKAIEVPVSGKSYLLDRNLAAAALTFLNEWGLAVSDNIHVVTQPVVLMEQPSRPSNAIVYLIEALVNNLKVLIEAVSLCARESSERHRVINAMSYADFETSLFGYALTEAEETSILPTLSPILMRLREVYEEMLDVAISCGRSSVEWATALRQFGKALTTLLDHLLLIQQRGKLREKWITETQAAKILRVHRGTVGRNNNIVTNGKIGRDKRISLLSVLRLVFDKKQDVLAEDVLDLRNDAAQISDEH